MKGAGIHFIWLVIAIFHEKLMYAREERREIVYIKILVFTCYTASAHPHFNGPVLFSQLISKVYILTAATRGGCELKSWQVVYFLRNMYVK